MMTEIALRDLALLFVHNNFENFYISETVSAGVQKKCGDFCRFGNLPSSGVTAKIEFRELDLLLQGRTF